MAAANLGPVGGQADERAFRLSWQQQEALLRQELAQLGLGATPSALYAAVAKQDFARRWVEERAGR